MIVELEPYPKIKDSGVEWLGQVPEHWNVLPGRACFYEKRTSNAGLIENTVLSLSYGKIKIKHEDKLHGLVPESFETYQIIEPGDIICRPTDLQNDKTSLRFGISPARGIITSAYMCFGVKSHLFDQYGYLLFHAYDLKKIFYGLGSGLRQNLDWGDFKYLPCVVPPKEEQSTIVRYLSYMDRRITRYIRAKQKLIKLLEEQKQAIIHQAVTGQIDVRAGKPYTKYKDSGVEWLGEVPEGWEVKRTKYIFKEQDLRSQTGSETHLSMSQKQGLVPSDMVQSSLKSESYIGGKLCETGDLVLNRLKAHLGVFALAKQPGVISPDYTVLRKIGNTRSEYFEKILRSPACRRELRTRAKGIVEGFWRLYTDDFYNILVPVPSLSEQNAIVEYSEKIVSELSDFVERIQHEIKAIVEYKTRLMADVVTGKIDVRHVVVNFPNELEKDNPTVASVDNGDDGMEALEAGDA